MCPHTCWGRGGQMRNRRLEEFKQRLQSLEETESEFEPSSPAPGPFLLARTAVLGALLTSYPAVWVNQVHFARYGERQKANQVTVTCSLGASFERVPTWCVIPPANLASGFGHCCIPRWSGRGAAQGLKITSLLEFGELTPASSNMSPGSTNGHQVAEEREEPLKQSSGLRLEQLLLPERMSMGMRDVEINWYIKYKCHRLPGFWDLWYFLSFLNYVTKKSSICQSHHSACSFYWSPDHPLRIIKVKFIIKP